MKTDRKAPRSVARLAGGASFLSSFLSSFLARLRAVGLGLLAALPAGCAPRALAAKSSKEPAPLVYVRTAPVQWAERLPPIRSIGVLAGKEEVKLSFKTGGLIERVMVDEGARVKAGQVLATLKRSEISAGVLQARRGLEKAERDRGRADDLYRGRAATLEQTQNAATAVDVAGAVLGAALFNEAHAVIRAPVAGTILRRMVEPDELVAPGAPVLLLRSAGRGWVVRAGVTDRNVMRVALGDQATLTFDALPGRALAAHVVEIAESASPLTGTYEVELGVDAAVAPLRSGLIAQVALRPRATARYGFIPLGALVEGDGDRATVYAPRGDGGVTVHPVVVAFVDGEEAAIATGLEGVREVVTDGAPRLSAGARIAPVAAGAGAP